jgi:alpha-1,6-mannosyltransferase
MRILQLANFYHSRSGGLRTAVDALAAGYVSAGHEVFLVIPGREQTVRGIGGKTVITLRGPRVPTASEYRTIVDHRAVSDLVAAVRPDVIELSDRTTLARIAVNLPGPGAAPSMLQPKRLVNAWTRRLAARVDGIVCASDFSAAEFERLTPAWIQRVPLGVDLETFCPGPSDESPLAPELGWSGGAHHRAVFVGRLSPEKHAQDAIAAVARLVRSGRLTELVVVGDGPQREELHRLGNGLPIRFVGHIAERSTIAAILRRADVAILPSPIETFGLSCLEAMACGTPVATVNGGAVSELVTRGSGVVARPGGLADAVAALFEGDRLLQRLEARRRAEEFPWQRTVDAMLDIHAAAVSSQRFAMVG